MKNILTFDIEEYYHRNDFVIKNKMIEVNQKVFEKMIYSLLNLLSQNKIKATFFVLASFAKNKKKIIRAIDKEGHEIASHGFKHNLVYTLTKKEFRMDVSRSIKILEDITGKKVLGYRAPSWSITEKSFWAINIIKESGFLYDSSIFPFRTGLYGVKNSERFPYEIIPGLFELPPSTAMACNIKIPFSSGVFFRLVPYFLIKYYINKINLTKHSTIISLHSWEFYKKIPRLKVSLKDYLRYKINFSFIHNLERKLSHLLEDFKFDSIKNILKIL